MVREFGSVLRWAIERFRLFPGSQRPEMMLFTPDEGLKLKMWLQSLDLGQKFMRSHCSGWDPCHKIPLSLICAH